MEDDCLAPNARLKIEYKGKNPFQVYKKAKSIITKVLQISSSYYWERDFRWDITTDPRKFFVRIYGKRQLDSRSYALTEVIFQGTQPSDENENGSVTILINGRLVTEYKLKSRLQKSNIYVAFLKLYNWIFYWKIRRQYLTMCKDFLDKINLNFKTILNIR